jgi:F0F1-type ATP synthase assembly protein I
MQQHYIAGVFPSPMRAPVMPHRTICARHATAIRDNFPLSGNLVGCYNSASWQGPLRLPMAIVPGVARMRDSMAAGRRLALRAVGLQAIVAVATACAFVLRDGESALAAAVGGGAVVVGSALMALRSVTGAPRGAGNALAGLVTGLLLKWFVVVGTLVVALSRLHLPPLPLLAGMVATTVAFLLIGKSPDKGVM